MKLAQYIQTLTFTAICAAGLVTASAGDLVPARARTSGTVVSKTYLADPAASPLGTVFLHVHSIGEGIGNRIGRYTVELDDYSHLAVIDGKLMVVTDGSYLATAANGDQLMGTYQNLRVFGELTFTGTSNMTGGTGRFQGVTGFETTVGEIASNLLDFSYEHDGYMASTGSVRGKGQ